MGSLRGRTAGEELQRCGWWWGRCVGTPPTLLRISGEIRPVLTSSPILAKALEREKKHETDKQADVFGFVFFLYLGVKMCNKSGAHDWINSVQTGCEIPGAIRSWADDLFWASFSSNLFIAHVPWGFVWYKFCCRCWVGLEGEREAPSTSWSSRRNSRRKCFFFFFGLLYTPVRDSMKNVSLLLKKTCPSSVKQTIRVFGRAFSWKVHWVYTLYWKFGQTGRIKALKHQIWRECGTGCWGDSSVVLPHVFPSVGFCDYMWLPHSL